MIFWTLEIGAYLQFVIWNLEFERAEGDDSNPNRRTRFIMSKVLVTGAGGFIGSHLAEELVRQGEEVRAFVRYNSRDERGLL